MEEAAREILRKVLQDILEMPAVGDYDDFFELGGDSMLALLVVVEAEKKGIPLPRNAVLSHPTLDELVRHAAASTRNLSQPGPIG